MSMVTMGMSYKTAPIECRERVAVPAEEIIQADIDLNSCEDIDGALVLSTCNRVEVYVDAKTDRIGLNVLEEWFAKRNGEPLDRSLYYTERGMDATEHLFRVVCSLDSQVLGEAQILGQTKRAFEAASEAGTCNDVMTELFKSALRLGKRARTETGIGTDSVSLSTTAFKVASMVFPNIAKCRALIVGAGEMAALAATYFVDAKMTDVTVVSRSLEHAQAFAAEHGIKAGDFADLYQLAAESDIVFSMTAAPEPVIRAAKLEQAREAAGTAGKRMIMVDEAVPRDIEDACNDLEGVSLYNLESLKGIVDDGLAERLASVADVERMVAEAEEEFLQWMQTRNVLPTIKDMYDKGNAFLDQEFSRAAKALAKERGQQLSDEEEAILHAYGEAIVKKLLHGPTVRLRKEANSADSYYYTGAARYLFGLDTFPAGTHHRPCGHPCKDGLPCPHGVPADHQTQCRTGEKE
ncbi:Glutamyl-tRNA reductase [Slackia heliotrinireducens]|uniref:Glutamyl-tRNA reductase n=1 Tax=Slackia heliotrinireducens (strain ATCC 29202 / DSM 20476 / NCTC 11029 / RHS 1) TaxID=471855 RepID=C7N5K9_SLAHD|nr:glutamyl-tRNA reductase [Slackia heliotrinireducens]ACV22194.1 glutamyl-tRNA reductase [Slackia heliotrinireducens DSM 20476]VEH00292.1 Glutamyl-tRNA reductase [Slackia heliotrinireducens]